MEKRRKNGKIKPRQVRINDWCKYTGIFCKHTVNKDNSAPNYECREEVEEEYKKYVEKKQQTLKWLVETFTNEDGTIDPDLYEDEYYLFLKMTPKERLSIPDSKFVGDGTWNSKTWPNKNGNLSSHKGGWHRRIRVPSLKREKATWQKFYNEFPIVAAEARFGDRRFINGAKLKYIW